MFSAIPIQSISNELTPHFKGSIDVLRLDKLHTIVSGNKWFKLNRYLTEAKAKGFDTIATFGGAYSNHIVATAYAAKLMDIQALGVIRGERPILHSHTLQNALDYGMKLQFVSRDDYRAKKALQDRIDPLGELYWISEGGYGCLGADGIRDLFKSAPLWQYTHILTAVGTGTTMAGLIKGAYPYQQIIGVSVLKNQKTLLSEIQALLTEEEKLKNYLLLHEQHWGGYAKKSPALLDFMNKVYQIVKLPLDFVYTAKAFYALVEMLAMTELPRDSRILFIHTGGLQGNLSLEKGSLLF